MGRNRWSAYVLACLALVSPRAAHAEAPQAIQYYRTLTGLVIRTLTDNAPPYFQMCTLIFFGGEADVTFRWMPLESGAVISINQEGWNFGGIRFHTRVRVSIDGQPIAIFPGGSPDGIVDATTSRDDVTLVARYPVLAALRNAATIKVEFPGSRSRPIEIHPRAVHDVMAAVDRCWRDTGYIEHDWIP